MGVSLLELTLGATTGPRRTLSDPFGKTEPATLAAGTTLGIATSQLRGRNVLLHVRRQRSAALALLELDGVASRVVICPPDLALSQLPAVIEKAGVEFLLLDDTVILPADITGALAGIPVGFCGLPVSPADMPPHDCETEWLLFTSGTTGTPKMAVHTLQSLTGAMQGSPPPQTPVVWSTFYDIRRYGGLQILLRAFTGGGSMLLSDAEESIADFLGRAGKAGVTHISGTPSHWRRALMSPSIDEISPVYARLSGEIADQVILNNLKTAFPAAVISHAYASTEAGVAFDVRDGLAGFPASWVNSSDSGVELRVRDGSLHIRSKRVSSRYAGEPERQLQDAEGFVDTGDMVDLRGDRYFFAGRREGVINVGGLKVHPEEIEAVINLHPAIRMSRAKSKKSPITGAVVAADIVLRDSAGLTKEALLVLRNEILQTCRDRLAPHKVPVLLREVPALEITAAGKLLRHGT